MRFRYIAVEGAPGAGKTALVKRIAERTESSTLLENANNPFLDDFVAGKSGAAFQTQMFFLLSRYRELSALAQRELFYQLKLADFMFARDKIYAYLRLEDTELMVYEKIYRVLSGEVPGPELVIYLQAPTGVLHRRLRQRGARPLPPEEELGELVRAYDYFFFHYSATPLLVVNCSHVDFSNESVSVDDLMQEIEAVSGGTRYFMPAQAGG